MLLAVALPAIIHPAQAQRKAAMLFPGGKTKALILSYDDGRTEDRKLVQLMNAHGLKGTFHLNSGKLGTTGYLTKEELPVLFKGHEVSVHSANHPNLTTLNKTAVVDEVIEDRKELERLTGNTVRGMAYPFGNYNAEVLDAMKGLGIEYARTVYDTYSFGIPADFLQWHPTIHQFGKAYFEPNNPANDQKEMDRFYKVINDFLEADSLALLDVWGHSWENGSDENKWKEMGKLFSMVSQKEVWSTTQIALVDYIHAYNDLRFSVDKSIVTNLSSTDVYIKAGSKAFTVTAGSTLVLTE